MFKNLTLNFIKTSISLMGMLVFMFPLIVYSQIFSPDNNVVQTDQKSTLVSPNTPAKSQPTKTIQTKPVLTDQSMAKASQKENLQEIRLYMRDFQISKNLNGSITCTMRFYVQSTLNQNISNITYRLNWPKIETPLSFDSIAAKSVTYQNYALLGDGCYTMDKTPNIIVNRCRIKGMTQQQCADLIRWVK